MTSSAHSQFNYNRRSSTSATPYTIPMKHHHTTHASHSHPHTAVFSPNSPHFTQHAPQHHHNAPQSHHHHNGHATHHRSHSYGHYQNQHAYHGSPTSLHEDSTINDGIYSEDEGYTMSSSVPVLSREFVVRRISEGETGRLKQELKCEACGKGYKHISSLAKHLWEHTPEWNVTKKLLISKHQQVQLLEAASILVGMNEFGPNSTSSRRNSVFNEDEDSAPTSKVPSPPHDDKPTKTEDNDLTFRDRKQSFSHTPPVATNTNQPGTHFMAGGYLDVKSSKDTTNGHLKPRAGSITDTFNSPSIMSPKKPSHDSDDDEIVGKME